MLITGININQVEDLEQIFAYMTPTGWEFPLWLVELRKHVEEGI